MPDNGLNPQWSQVNFACAVWSPEQTLLKVSIYNSKSSLLGKGSKVLLAYAMVPVCALRDGFRSLQLRSPHGCPIEACTLFVHLAADPIAVAPPQQPTARAADTPCTGLGPGEAEPQPGP